MYLTLGPAAFVATRFGMEIARCEVIGSWGFLAKIASLFPTCPQRNAGSLVSCYVENMGCDTRRWRYSVLSSPGTGAAGGPSQLRTADGHIGASPEDSRNGTAYRKKQ